MRTTSTFTILFWINNDRVVNGIAPIYARITVSGKRTNLSLKCKTNVTNWCSVRQRVKGSNIEAKRINPYLDQVQSQLFQVYQDLKFKGELVTAELVNYTPHALVEFVLNKTLPYPNKRDSNYNVKVLDPTCGSGIFLVESLNRLLDTWEYSNPELQIDFSVIERITKDNIYGIEKNGEAVKVAAFSIYLTMLNRLNPKTLWERKRFPRLIYNEKEPKTKTGSNLFPMSSLGTGPFEKVNYDLIIGNPPFKRGSLDKEGKEYLNNRDYAQEYVLAFLDRSITLCPTGKIALVAASKILFNTSGGYRNFRKFLFQENYVESIYNFSILRKVSKSSGGNFFASAVGPACVIFYSKSVNAEDFSNKILYCAPRTYKNLLKNKIIDALVVDKTDIKYLPREECQNPDSKIWKVSMWGTERDFKLINSLSTPNNLENFLEKCKWSAGVGFQTSKPLKFKDYEISKIPFVSASKIERYGTSVANTTEIDRTIFRRRGTKSAYKAPHILIKEGQQNKKICASYFDYDCSFTSTVYGISGKPKDADQLKLLTAYINSKLSTYYLFLTASSWGIERERIKPNEILKLPDQIFTLAGDSKELLEKVEKRINLTQNQSLDMRGEIKKLELEIDEHIFSLFQFSEEEKILIEDCISYNLDSFQEGIKSKAYAPVNQEFSSIFGKYLIKELNNFLGKSSDIQSENYTYDVSPNTYLNILTIVFDSATTIKYEKPKLNKLLQSLEKASYSKYSESIYFRKAIRFYTGDVIHIIKPNEKRFWTRAMAFSDADEIISEIINMEIHDR